MAGLGIRLGAGDKLVVNGAAIQFETAAQIRLANQVNFLFGRQILAPDEVTTPARRIYFALQTAHVGTQEERGAALESARYFIRTFAEETTSANAKALLKDALEAAEGGDGYRALQIARRIIRHEDAVFAATPEGRIAE